MVTDGPASTKTRLVTTGRALNAPVLRIPRCLLSFVSLSRQTRGRVSAHDSDDAARVRLPPSGAGIFASSARSGPRRVHLPFGMTAQVLVLKLCGALAVLTQGIG